MPEPAPDLLPIAVTLGDPAGIGPEIVLKALQAEPWASGCIVVGDAANLARQAASLGLPMPAHVHRIDADENAEVRPGEPGPLSGDIAYRSVLKAVGLQQSGRVRAIVTAPLAKSAMQAAGHDFPGHTELLAALAGGVPVRMMLANDELRVVLVTIHLPLRAALDRLDESVILETLQIADRSLRLFGLAEPRLAVAGVNPHAGEDGLFGREEIDLVAPAVRRARESGIQASGPWPPDTVFMMARGGRRFDAVIAMYHDQGLIPVKYNGIENGVNITLGLPYVRTSPDHGTAFDIAGQGIADPSSLLSALRMADELSRPGALPAA
ncbi:MAG: 4-hydroxythreonine-4-phosphate dehydrogenase PdxA [Burkholderiaceae bacterium]